MVKNQRAKQRELRTLGDCWQWKADGQWSKGDNCSFRHDIDKRAKMTQPNLSPSSFMQQNERNASRTRSSRARVPVVECFDGLARISSKGTCTNSFCEMCILQYACSTSRKTDANVGKSALMHTARLMNSLAKGQKRMVTKSAVALLKKVIGMKENLLPTNVTIDRGNLIRGVIRSWDEDHLNVDHLMHDNWVVYFKTWSRRSLFSGRALTCRSQSNVWTSQRPLRVTLKIRDQNPSLGMICPGEPHERSPNAPKFWGSVSGGDRVARARCPRSSVEAGPKVC